MSQQLAKTEREKGEVFSSFKKNPKALIPGDVNKDSERAPICEAENQPLMK
jgi:hypothetical protein